MARTPPRRSVSQCKDCAEAGEHHFDAMHDGGYGDLVGVNNGDGDGHVVGDGDGDNGCAD